MLIPVGYVSVQAGTHAPVYTCVQQPEMKGWDLPYSLTGSLTDWLG